GDESVANLDDLAEQAAGSHHFIAGSELRQQCLVLLGLLLLRTNQQKVKNGDERHHGRKGHKTTRPANRSGLGIGVRNQTIHTSTLSASPPDPGGSKGAALC